MHLCVHPHQVTERRVSPGGWHRYREGRRWRLSYVHGVGVLHLSCPDCPARATQADFGTSTAHVMPPWLVADPAAA